VLLLTVALVAAGALALTHSSARGTAAPRHVALLVSSATCSAASDCVQGCALAVAQHTRSPRSPTNPCASQAITACTEYVAAPTAKAGTSACVGPQHAERLQAPKLFKLLPKFRKEAEKTLETLRAKDKRARSR
jgi:hypothetical protein